MELRKQTCLAFSNIITEHSKSLGLLRIVTKGKSKCDAADSKWWRSGRPYKANNVFAAGFGWSGDNCSLVTRHRMARLRHQHSSRATLVLCPDRSCRNHL